MKTCNKDHTGDRPRESDGISDAQAARWRHRCAHELGRRHGHEAEERLRGRVRDLSARVKDLEVRR